ncbi:MAG: DUF1656 domain-containing protein [Nevskia sp.]|nr:DUF1656 domain-containing protein [Nevskia sp.]
MIPDIFIGGVYIPGLLALAFASLILSSLLSRPLGRIGLYRFLAYRPLVDVAQFILVLGGVALVASLLRGRS